MDVINALLSFVGGTIGGAVGGAVVVFLETRARRMEEKRRRVEELRGLLILIAGEIAINKSSMEGYLDALPSLQETGDLKHMESVNAAVEAAAPTIATKTVWDSANTRLAQLLAAEKIMPLLEYYSQFFPLAPALSRLSAKEENASKLLSELLKTIIKRGDRAQAVVEQEMERAEHLAQELQKSWRSRWRKVFSSEWERGPIL